MPVGRALHIELSSAPTSLAAIGGTARCSRPTQRVSLLRFVAALCARALART
jgi:hypothetical protein